MGYNLVKTLWIILKKKTKKSKIEESFSKNPQKKHCQYSQLRC